MTMKTKVFILCICLAVLYVLFPTRIYADENEDQAVLSAMPAKSIIAVECSSGKVLFEKNSDEKISVSHLAKLMLLLLTAEKVESGEISLTDTVTVSANANSMPAPQIWLDKNEKISVEELLKAITTGNANDASVALAEHLFGSEDKAVKLMNDKAKQLDMVSTAYIDVCGIDPAAVSTAADTAKLASELVKYDILTPYLTSWLEYVRDGKAELVNLNRLVRTYKGITGLKACSSKTAGECSAVSAKRGDMHVAVVVIGCDTRDNCDDIAKKLLNMSFDGFSLYTPEISGDMLEKIPVAGGEKANVSVSFEDLVPAVVPKGASASVDVTFEKDETLKAPVKQGQICGKLTCTLNGETVYSADLTAGEDVKQKSFKFCFKQLLLYLIKI